MKDSPDEQRRDYVRRKEAPATSPTATTPGDAVPTQSHASDSFIRMAIANNSLFMRSPTCV
eukprot:11352131-Heterocapsa_arctica.AAC.1